MKRHHRLLRTPLLLLLPAILFALSVSDRASAADRPNFVWILSEDNSTHFLRLFNEHGAKTPEIERLAREGVTFTRAFSCSPVCSVARTTLATGVYAPRIGAQFHRKERPVQLPDGWQIFSAYLREAGYYCTNNSKTDYNTTDHGRPWDESSQRATWRKRPKKDAPFFHMQSFGDSHESRLHFDMGAVNSGRVDHDPAKMKPFPYFPDTKIFRFTHARQLDNMQRIDRRVGDLVDKLREDGLLEDTFVFYFGDHGGVMPRSKGYLYETGLHVPLVVRVPEKWKSLSPFSRGEKSGGFVEFVDFGPTLLHMAGLKVPKHMDGAPFLGKAVEKEEVNARDAALGYADRFDEKYDLVRTLRKGRWKYFRNYQGYYPDGLQNNYRYRQLAYRQWRSLFRDGKLEGPQRHFYQPRPAEMLFDLESDPHEINNLAGDPQYREKLLELRGELQQRLKNLPDLSFYPESLLVEEAVQQPIAFGKKHREEIARLVDTADLCLLPTDQAVSKLREALKSSNRWVRYWAATACAVIGEEARPLVDVAKPLLEDPELLVRIRAAEFLGRIKAADPRPALSEVLRETGNPVTASIALNAVVYLRDMPEGYKFDIRRQDVMGGKKIGGQYQRRLEYLER